MNTVLRNTVVIGLASPDPRRTAVQCVAEVGIRRDEPLRMQHASRSVAIVHPDNQAARP